MDVLDRAAMTANARFYRLAPLGSVPGSRLGVGAPPPLGPDGFGLVLFSVTDLFYRIDASSDLLA